MDIGAMVDAQGGVVSANQLASILGIDPAEPRLWAKRHDVPVVGNSFVFTPELAEAFVANVFGEDALIAVEEEVDESDDDEEDESEDDDEDDEDIDDGDDED